MEKKETKAKAATASPPKAGPKSVLGKEHPSAIDKIRDEMAMSNKRYVQIIGEYLTGYVQTHPEAGEKILAVDKDIHGSIHWIRSEAEKHKEGNVGIVDDETAFGIVLKYFGITPSQSPSAPALPLKGASQGEAQTSADVDLFDLDALLASSEAELRASASAAPPETRGQAPATDAGRETGGM